MELRYDVDAEGITLLPVRKAGLARLFARRSAGDLRHLPASERDLICAIADLRALSGDDPRQLEIADDRIRLSHRLAAQLDAAGARALGLPKPVDLTLSTDVEGVVGASGFRLVYRWTKAGQTQWPTRVGAILETAQGDRLVPHWMLDAIEIADAARTGGADASDWEALARFRQALEPGLTMSRNDDAARISMTDFLSGLEVRLADAFSISPTAQGDDFDVVPFSRERLRGAGAAHEGEVDEAQGELEGETLVAFQRRLRDRGALPAYRVRPGSYLIIDRSAMPALKVMAERQRAPSAERRAFMADPRPRLTEAIMADREARGLFEGLDPQDVEEAAEAFAGPVFVETAQYSERVLGVAPFEREQAPPDGGGGTTWLPEDFSRRLSGHLDAQTPEALEALRREVEAAIEAGRPSVLRDGLEIPAGAETLATIGARLASEVSSDPDEEPGRDRTEPIVLASKSNLRELEWFAALAPRRVRSRDLPALVKTPLKPHQQASFAWQIAAFEAGLPGVLNADEQGLGKTLQTIAFLSWLQAEMVEPALRRPLLIVAPTSLLLNWEQEVARHLREPGLGHVIRLYGAGTGTRKRAGARGRDIDGGAATLDLAFLQEAIAEGRAHRFWVLTTYTTLTNYQHSLAPIPFAAAVFDEIQALKNNRSMRAAAARTVKADFTIGLTGTPIENSVLDLWSIMDRVAPGRLDTEADFRARYRSPDAAAMADLHARVFDPREGVPPIGIRRLKSDVATDLPAKRRRLYPRAMPGPQQLAYEDARLKLARGGAGAALTMLHHIRTVSVHPDLDGDRRAGDFIAASARLTACFDLLRRIRAKGERALVFVEHRRMQYRFIELAKAELGLAAIDLINGDTPIRKRQEIVDRFQKHGSGPGFDLLVLGPKAAGTGLTLTAATHVVHLSRWWNPAVEEQCNDRVHRIGQTRPVTIHLPMAIHTGYREGSFDCLLHSLMQRKRKLAEAALWPMGDTAEDAAHLEAMLRAGADHQGEGEDPVRRAMHAMFARDGLAPPEWQEDGSILAE
ncbi:DEAD/DEAH box helicase [Prosthecomicrobium pneumaticum]|uniref:Superfamily II DNA or RNA helicase n=1 Tax=Prosthecomicrobium pneumaticum TaxID=81895 RepID=A0A7W9FMG6_9HYPH|nr:DEAD/DEAH box helicase [Prosthecomicrobium pneumaticum]MBB5753360.1 superfamily II DNA or RNA helicase [Prosthecomicrobium pneumaticum]